MKKRLRPEFSVLASLLILSGIALLLESNSSLKGIHNMWPIFVLMLGMGLIFLFSSNKRDIGLLWLGSFMIMLSILFFYLNFTSWAQLKRLWPLFIAIASISILICYFYNKERILLLMGIFGILLSAAFILIFGISSSLWPVSLIISGIFIYIISIFIRK